MNELLAGLMAFLASLFGGSMGWAILLLALAVRLALLPLTLHLSRKMLANQQKMHVLRPQVEAIKGRLHGDPRAAFAAVSALYKEHGVRVFDRSSLLGAVLQLPVFAMLYKAVSQASAGSKSFLWMKSLALPDTALTAIVLLLTGIAAWYFPSASGDAATLTVVLQVLVMAFVVCKLSAGVGLYWAASSGVSALQTLVLRRDRHRAQRLAGSGMTM
jgi:YidC/Oxa1 family membrane protein insertase